MRNDEITLLIPVGDIELTEALSLAGIEYNTPARDGLTFDSGLLYAFIALVNAEPMAKILIAYIQRNKGKRAILKNGQEEIDLTGYSEKEVIKIISEKKKPVIEVSSDKSR